MASSGILPGEPIYTTPPKRNGNNEAITHTNDAVLIFLRSAVRNGDYIIREIKEDIPFGNVAATLLKNKTLKDAWKSVTQLAATTTNKSEGLMYLPIAAFLTLLANPSLSRTDTNGSEITKLFIPWDRVTRADESERLRQDIIAVEATLVETWSFLKDPSWNTLPKRYLDGHNNPRIYYSDIHFIIEVKAKAAAASNIKEDVLQLIKYFFTASRYQPRHAAYRGVLAYRDGFITVHYFPDIAVYSQTYKWKDKVALNVLADLFNTQLPFTTKEFRSCIVSEHEWLGNISSRLQYTSGNNVYQLFDLFHGLGWNRNTYIGLGIPMGTGVNKSRDCRVFKHGWYDIRRSTNEYEVLKHIFHPADGKKRCTAGIIRPDLELCRIIKDSEEVPELFDADNEEIPARDDIVVSFKTIGETLASCRSVRQFLMAMYDLVEG